MDRQSLVKEFVGELDLSALTDALMSGSDPKDVIENAVSEVVQRVLDAEADREATADVSASDPLLSTEQIRVLKRQMSRVKSLQERHVGRTSSRAKVAPHSRAR